MDDGTTKIFLNALGTKGDVSPELKAFLGYVAGHKSDDEFVKELDAEVAKVRESKEWKRTEPQLRDVYTMIIIYFDHDGVFLFQLWEKGNAVFHALCYMTGP